MWFFRPVIRYSKVVLTSLPIHKTTELTLEWGASNKRWVVIYIIWMKILRLWIWCGFFLGGPQFWSKPILSGWWLNPTPLKNDGVGRLGLWHSQLFLESHSKFHGSSHHQPERNMGVWAFTITKRWHSAKYFRIWLWMLLVLLVARYKFWDMKNDPLPAGAAPHIELMDFSHNWTVMSSVQFE